MLNHTDSLALDSNKISNPFILNLYGINAADNLIHFQTNNHWLSLAGESVFFDTELVFNCSSLVGFTYLDSTFVAACQDRLVLLTEQGQLIETISEFQGLPVPLEALGLSANDNQLVVSLRTGNFFVNLAELSWIPVASLASDDTGNNIEWSQPTQILNPNLDEIKLAYTGNDITFERVLLDLHSGRLFGISGVIVNDIFALLLISLAISGFWAWYTRRRRLKRIHH